MLVSRSSVVKWPKPPFPEEPSPTASAVMKEEWLVAGRAREKLQTAGSQPPEAPGMKGTNRSTPFIRVKGDAPASKENTFLE